jgi:4-hydroxy-2-oxoglutarate aldolase
MTELPRGIIPPIVTPFRGGAFDESAFRENIGLWNRFSLAGYLACGSNGEGVFMTDDEIVRVVEAAASARAKGKFLLAGTGRESTRRTIELSGRAARAGAQAVLVVPPSYYRSSMTDSALDRHYRAIADASEVPVVLYHVPKFSPVQFSTRLVLGLAGHPNIRGIKETSGDLAFLSSILAGRPPEFRVYVGSGGLLLPGLLLGADGGIVALANVAPAECVSIEELAAARQVEEARALQLRLLALNHAITNTHGVAGLKHAMGALGYHPGEVAPPLEPVGAREAAEIEALLEKAGLRGSAAARTV